MTSDLYSARFAYPDYLQREADNSLSLPVFLDGAPAVPTSGTVTVKDGGGVAIVDAQPVVVTDGVATYQILAATLPSTLPYSNDWMEVWALVLDGATRTFNRPAGLARTLLYPVITDDDLLDEYTEMRRWQAEDQGNLSNYIDAAWKELMGRLCEDGRRPNLILSPYSLRSAHLKLSGAKAFRDYASSASKDGKFWKMYETEIDAYHKAWDRMTLRYDYDEDGNTGGNEVSAAPVTFLAMPSDGWWG